MAENNKPAREKIMGIYDKIKEDLYLCRNDLEVYGASYNSALLFGTLTEINKGNQ